MCDDERLAEAEAEASEAVALDAHRDARQLVRLVQCPRCSEPLSTPVTLPCGHTVCRGCLPPPQARTNISYPNTPDRLMGIACPLLGCGAEHAAAECSVDVTLTKLMDLIKAEIVEHRPSAADTPTLLVEIPQDDEVPMDEKEKETASHDGRQQEDVSCPRLPWLRWVNCGTLPKYITSRCRQVGMTINTSTSQCWNDCGTLHTRS
jgi:hypothetical protein